MSKFEIECGIVICIYKCMSLSILMQLFLFNYYFRIFKPVLGLLFEHTLNRLFLVLKFIRITLS